MIKGGNVGFKPIIRWAGSKRKLLPVLKENAPESYSRYVEPFCGSASFFFEQSSNCSILTDINFELINALNEIKTNKDIRSLVVSIPSTKEVYYKVRSQDPELLDKTERAVRFLYLNRYCFNGVYRTNKEGRFNVPMGTKTGEFPSQETFNQASEKLQSATLKVADYIETLRGLKEGDFVYIDPPYTKSGKNVGEYGPGSFTSNNLQEFLGELNALNQKRVKFLFSYRACKETIDQLSLAYIVKHINVKRHVAGFKTTWDNAEEILVKNYE